MAFFTASMLAGLAMSCETPSSDVRKMDDALTSSLCAQDDDAGFLRTNHHRLYMVQIIVGRTGHQHPRHHSFDGRLWPSIRHHSDHLVIDVEHGQQADVILEHQPRALAGRFAKPTCHDVDPHQLSAPLHHHSSGSNTCADVRFDERSSRFVFSKYDAETSEWSKEASDRKMPPG
jgi:hypothetical protein